MKWLEQSNPSSKPTDLMSVTYGRSLSTVTEKLGVNPLPNKVELAVAAWRWGAYLGKDALKNGVRCRR